MSTLHEKIDDLVNGDDWRLGCGAANCVYYPKPKGTVCTANLCSCAQKARNIVGRVKMLLMKDKETWSDIPDFGDHMTLEEFKDSCDCGAYVNYDGIGQYASATQESSVYVKPSDVFNGLLDTSYTHVVWYNK